VLWLISPPSPSPFPCFFVSRRDVVSPLIAQDKVASVEVDDILRFFVAQIVLDKTRPIKDMMPEMGKYLEQIREVVKPIVAGSQSPGTEWGSPQYLHAQVKRLYVYQLQVVSVSVLIGGAFQSTDQD
jgi:hypothetical protein